MLTEETLLMNINKVDGGNIEVNCKHWHSCAILTNVQTYLDDIDNIDKNENGEWKCNICQKYKKMQTC